MINHMIRFLPIKTSDSGYGFIENLLHESFPSEERRDDNMQRNYTDHNSLFTAYLIMDDDIKIGLITLWKLDSFYYVEHLATSPNVRNKGYGKLILQSLLNDFSDLKIVLEVELPQDEYSKRRIGFYERNGFRLCHKPYMQPPYRKGGSSIPMYLMFSSVDNIDDVFDSIKSEIHREVYSV